MSIEIRSTNESATVDPENILQMEPIACDFGKFANPGMCNLPIIEVSDTVSPPPATTYPIYYGTSVSATMLFDEEVTALPSQMVVPFRRQSFVMAEATEAMDTAYKWICLNKEFGEVTDLSLFKVGTFSANMMYSGETSNYYCYRTINQAFGAVTINLEG
jgi:hypothetical protein